VNYDARELARVRNPVLVISAVTWMLLLAEPRGFSMIAHCSAISSGAVPWSASVPMSLVSNPPASLAVGWALMLVAMMSPVLIPAIRHVRMRSFAHRRVRLIALFVIGYAAVWMGLGGALAAIEVPVKLFARESYLPAAVVVVVALVWQFSPLKQRCLNRCHAYAELAAFGAAADWDALRFGMRHGTWCAGSCWALMLFPMLLPRGHVVAMALVAVLIFSERLEQASPPRWRIRGPGKAIRIAVAQARIRLRLRPGAYV
jgi:predicted metal-binding membrane protein